MSCKGSIYYCPGCGCIAVKTPLGFYCSVCGEYFEYNKFIDTEEVKVNDGNEFQTKQEGKCTKNLKRG